MTFNRSNNSFDSCSPPICHEDVNINIINIFCTEENVLYVDWEVTDLNDREVSSNSLFWSCDNRDLLNNESTPSNNAQPYRAFTDISGCDGIIYLKVKVRIGTSFFESEVHLYDTDLCMEQGGDVVPASLCDSCSEYTSSLPEYFLYVRSSSISKTPIFLKYGGFCWTITNMNNEMPVSDIPEGSFLIYLSTTYSSCSECCESL